MESAAGGVPSASASARCNLPGVPMARSRAVSVALGSPSAPAGRSPSNASRRSLGVGGVSTP
eukprot:476773-Pleurochrysis_carterae.AAC.1